MLFPNSRDYIRRTPAFKFLKTKNRRSFTQMPPMLSKSLGCDHKPCRRIVLNERIAAEIYAYKLKLLTPTSFESCFQPLETKIRGESSRLCTRYGVSSKTIRDIWNRRSWTTATTHLWMREESAPPMNSTQKVSSEQVARFGFGEYLHVHYVDIHSDS